MKTLLQNAQGSLDEWKDFTCDERADFMKKGKECGRNLHKQMVESTQWVETRKETTKFDKGGKLEDEDELEEKYKDKPDILDNIKANAASMIDPVRLVRMFYAPKYSVLISKENSLTEGSKRKLESETTVRKAVVPSKKPKTGKEPLAVRLFGDGEPLAEQEEAQTWGEMPQVDIPPGQILRITRSLPKLEEVQLNFSTTMVEAEAPEVSEFMAPKLLERARALRSVLDKTIVNYKSKRESKKAAKGEMKEHLILPGLPWRTSRTFFSTSAHAMDWSAVPPLQTHQPCGCPTAAD